MNKIIEIYNTFASMVGIPIATSASDLLERSVCWLITTILLMTSIFYEADLGHIDGILDLVLTFISIFGKILWGIIWMVVLPLMGYNYLSSLAKRYDSKDGSDE